MRYQARGCNRVSIRDYAERLRTFLRYAEQQGWCPPGLASGILPSRTHPGEALPKGLERDEVERLLASSEGDRCCFQLFFVGFVPDSAVTKWLGNRTNLEWYAEANARQVAYSVQLTGPLAAIPFLQ